MAAREDAYINKISFGIILKLNRALDSEDKWKELLATIQDNPLDGPPLDPDFRGILDNCHQRKESPTERLLNELGQKGYRVMHLKHWLRLAGLQRALDLLEGGDSTTGFQQPLRGRSQSYGGQETPPRRLNLHHSATMPEKGSGGKTIELSQQHLTPYENTGEGDLSDGDDVGGGTIELGQSSVKPYSSNQERSSHFSQQVRRRRTAEDGSETSSEVVHSSGHKNKSSVGEPTISHKHSLVDYKSVPPTSAESNPPTAPPDNELNEGHMQQQQQQQQQQHKQKDWWKILCILMFLVMVGYAFSVFVIGKNSFQ